MRPGLKKIVSLMSLLLAVTWLYSCGGSSDLLDEPNQRYRASIVIRDGETTNLTIDTVQSMCDSEPEEFFDVFADMNIIVDADALGISLDYYTLEYFPLMSQNGLGELVLPPDLDDPGVGFFDIDIPSGASSEFSVTCLGLHTKQEYENKLAALAVSDPASYSTLRFSRYTIRITFYFVDEADVDREIVLERTVYLGPYNNC
jgi:hypothetical protein